MLTQTNYESQAQGSSQYPMGNFTQANFTQADYSQPDFYTTQASGLKEGQGCHMANEVLLVGLSVDLCRIMEYF